MKLSPGYLQGVPRLGVTAGGRVPLLRGRDGQDPGLPGESPEPELKTAEVDTLLRRGLLT